MTIKSIDQLSIVKNFTTHLKKSLSRAMEFANEFGHEQVTVYHLLYGLASEKGSLSAEILQKFNLPVDLLKQDLIRRYHTPYLSKEHLPDLSDEVIKTLTKAVRTAHLYKHTYIGTEHVLACLLDLYDKNFVELFNIWNIKTNELKKQVLVILKSTSKFPDLTDTLRYLQNDREEEQNENEFPVLQTFAQEMTTVEYLKECSPLIGREKELDRLLQIIGRKNKNNPLLIGKAGVGKTAIVEGLADLIVNKKHIPYLNDKRIFLLSMSSLVAGTMFRGDFEQRLKLMIEEISQNRDIILFIDEIHTLVGAGSSGQSLDAANILKPALARGQIRCIGATTWDEYQEHFTQDSALTRRFQMIPISEPDKNQTAQILRGIKKDMEDFHHLTITKDALATSVDLSERYLTHTCWPDKAIDLIDEAASKVLMDSGPSPLQEKIKNLKKQAESIKKQKQQLLSDDQYNKALEKNREFKKISRDLLELSSKNHKRNRLTAKHIRAAVAARTGIDESRLFIRTEPLAHKLINRINKEIIGQEKAIVQLSNAVQRAYSPLKPPHKPMGAYLFLGPSGVGKTATAKSLAKHVFGTEDSLIRLDMSEYSEKFTTSKLIGAPAGYVGYQKSGTLTTRVQQHPLSLVLFDEVEKANPDIFHLLLQILDEGKLADGAGHIVDFRQTMIIMTSNLGLNELQNKLGFVGTDNAANDMRNELASAAKKFFAQELLNRLDDIIYFSPLKNDHKQVIIKKKLAEIEDNIKDIISLNISDNVIKFLAQNSYVNEQGVRSLEKAIRQQIEIPLSGRLFQIKKGSMINVVLEDEKIIFND